MLDVFFCSLGIRESDMRRKEMRSVALERWLRETDIQLHELAPLDVSPYEFQRARRIWADQLAATSIYMVVDSDVLLPPDSQIPEALATMEKYPEFAILAPMWLNNTIHPWTPEGRAVVLNDDIMEHHSVGTARFCRKGALKEWPPMEGPLPSYDREHCEALRGAGWRVGYLRNIKWMHLGEGQSTVWAPAVTA